MFGGTTTAGAEMFFDISAAIGQFSGRIISERTHEGLAAATVSRAIGQAVEQQPSWRPRLDYSSGAVSRPHAPLHALGPSATNGHRKRQL